MPANMVRENLDAGYETERAGVVLAPASIDLPFCVRLLERKSSLLWCRQRQQMARPKALHRRRSVKFLLQLGVEMWNANRNAAYVQ